MISLISIVIIGLLIFNHLHRKDINPSADTGFDIQDLESRNFTAFKEFSDYFQKLAEKKGARYAFEVLRRAPMSPNIDMHLLGHVVGDVLYKQEGLNGIKICNNDFRNACSHSIVTGLFFDKGEAALPEIAQACRQAPGGSGAYTMCFHGLGHGILAAVDYDMSKAAVYCDKTSTPQYSYNEGPQCIGGMVMEIIGGGGHDRNLWAAQRVKYLDKKDPIGLCSRSFISDKARFMCYTYVTPYLFEVVGANMSNPTGTDFKKSFPFCNKININDKSSRDACYGGFGKEFIGIVQSRDIRQSAIENISNGQLAQIYKWCKLADNKEGRISCILSAANSLYWGGENSPDITIRYCGLIDDHDLQNVCYENLIGAAFFYVKDTGYFESFCKKLPPVYLNDCRTRTAAGAGRNPQN